VAVINRKPVICYRDTAITSKREKKIGGGGGKKKWGGGGVPLLSVLSEAECYRLGGDSETGKLT